VQQHPPGTAVYRADIDGLRAVAVLSVMLFHASRRLLPGGFVGVDVFFVISGFLITRNIVGELAAGRFSLLGFYARRVRRIAPMMLVIVLVTLIAAAILMVPEDVRNVAKSAVWSLASLANVYFWRYEDHSYFAADSAESPLLHLWSLGVEEQFYLGWPLLLLLLYRPARAGLFCAGATLVAIASFAMGNLLFQRDPSFVYYMMPTRAGELLLGALVAIWGLREANLRLPATAAAPLAWVGLGLLGLSLALLSPDTIFPGVAAAVPTTGTALLIAAGAVAPNPVTRALAIRPLVWVGLISYSAYLWHWPLLAFFRYGFGAPGALSATILLGCALGAAAASYYLIEQPARHFRGRPWRVFAWEYIAPAAAVGALAIALVYPQRLHLPWPSAGYQARLAAVRAATSPAYESDFICQQQRLTVADTENPRCVLGAPGSAPPRVIIWGDSNAAHYVGMLTAVAQRAGFRFRNLEVGSCPPVSGDPAAFVAARRLADCRASLGIVWPVLAHYDVVIVSASWPEYAEHSSAFLPAAFATIRELTLRRKLVVLIGAVPIMQGYDRRCAEKALSYPALHCPNITRPLADSVARVNGELRAFAERTADVRYFDATRELCTHGLCSESGPGGLHQYYDERHLSTAASLRLGARILSEQGIPPAFAAVAQRVRDDASATLTESPGPE
jgi:peptidoglycan/LPS O-acetylase OafA/YrhL